MFLLQHKSDLCLVWVWEEYKLKTLEERGKTVLSSELSSQEDGDRSAVLLIMVPWSP